MGRQVKDTLYRRYFEGSLLNNSLKGCDNAQAIKIVWESFIGTARDERKARLLNNSDIIKQCEKFIKEIESRMDYRTDILEFIQYKDLLYTIEKEKGSLYRQGMGGLKSAKTKEEKKNSNKYSDWVVLDYHTFSVNAMYDFKYNTWVRSPGYRKWIAKFPSDKVPPLEEYSENGIDLVSPIGIEVRVIQKEQCDVDNGLKSIIDRLVDIWGLPDDNHVGYASIEKIGICDDYKDGKIMFRVYNKEE